MLHTKIKEREVLFSEEIGEVYTEKYGEVNGYKTDKILAFNRTSSIELLQAVVEMIKEKKRIGRLEGWSAGEEVENYGYNQALSDLQSLLLDEINKIKE